MTAWFIQVDTESVQLRYDKPETVLQNQVCAGPLDMKAHDGPILLIFLPCISLWMRER